MADTDLIGLPTASNIASRYNTCATSFTRLNQFCIKPGYSYAEQFAPSAVQDEFGRFRVWAGNIGAHRTGRVSLDYRLREASHMYQRVTELLDELNTTLEEVIAIVSGERKPYDDEFSDSDSSTSASSDEDSESETVKKEGGDSPASVTELQQRALDVNDIVSCLYKLSVAIRNPAPSDRLAKSALIDTAHFVSWDVRHVTEKYPGADPSLINRLGEANAKRRQLLKYMDKHHGKLARKVNDLPKIEEPSKDGTDIPTDVPKALQPHGGKLEDAQSQPATVRTTPSALATTVNTQTTVATFLEVTEDMAMEDSQSETSSATSASTNDDGALRVPPPPKGAMDGEPFECPYCFDMMTIRSMISWRKHVFRDLQPYLCTFADCTRPNRMFSSRHAWRNHEIHTHRREWLCNACQRNFFSKPDLENHMRAAHAGSFADRQLSALIDMCERPIAPTALEKCPLCLQENQPLKSHLARHLQTLALFTLPRKDSDSDDDMASMGAHVWHSDDEEDDERMEGMGDVESGSEVSSAGMREIPDVVEEEANLDVVRTKLYEMLIPKIMEGSRSNVKLAALDIETWTEEERKLFLSVANFDPSRDPERAVALVLDYAKLQMDYGKKLQEQEMVKSMSRGLQELVHEPDLSKYVVKDGTRPDITVHTMEDGTEILVSAAPEDAQNAICPELIDIVAMAHRSFDPGHPLSYPNYIIGALSKEQKLKFEMTFGFNAAAEPESAVALILGWEKLSQSKATEESKRKRARHEFFKRLGSKIRQQQTHGTEDLPVGGDREQPHRLLVDRWTAEERDQFRLYADYDGIDTDPELAVALALSYEEEALRNEKQEEELSGDKEGEALAKVVNQELEEEGKPNDESHEQSPQAETIDQEASMWPPSRVIQWLVENDFPDQWIGTLEGLRIHGFDFLDLKQLGNIYTVVFPQLRKDYKEMGIEWDEARERKEAVRMADLILLRGFREEVLRDEYLRLKNAEYEIDQEFKNEKIGSTAVEARKGVTNRAMSRLRHNVEASGRPLSLFDTWEMERLKDRYKRLKELELRIAAGDPDSTSRQRLNRRYPFESEMKRLKNSMTGAGLPMSLLAEWDTELRKPEEEQSDVDLAMKKFNDQVQDSLGEGPMSQSTIAETKAKNDREVDSDAKSVGKRTAEEKPGYYALFVENLVIDVDEFLLMSTFDSKYPSCVSASVWEHPEAREKYGAGRNYGIVRFSDYEGRQKALNDMQGVTCGSSAPMHLSLTPPDCWPPSDPKSPSPEPSSRPGGLLGSTEELENDDRDTQLPTESDPSLPLALQATSSTKGTASYDLTEGPKRYEAIKLELSKSSSYIEEVPSFSPFPKIRDRPSSLPPSDEDKEIILEKARNPVLHSDDPEMQLAWAQDALMWVEIAENDGHRISKRPSTPLIERGIRKDAIAIVTFLAEQKHPKAMFMKGMWHEFGKFGYRVDKKEALLHMRTAAEKGYYRAYYRIGMAYESSNDAQKAIEMYWKGVEYSDSAACYRMGMMQILGQHGVMQDRDSGMDLLTKSAGLADENAPQGAYVLGMLKLNELPQVQMPDIYRYRINFDGKSLVEKAAFLGFSKAQTRMGQAYELVQLDCEFDPTISLHYYVLAARQGEPEAEMSVSKWFLSGYEGIFDKSPELAFEYAQRAARSEYALAEFALGYYHEVGIHVPISFPKAITWYERAAAKGHKDAIDRLDSLKTSPEYIAFDMERNRTSSKEFSNATHQAPTRLQMPEPRITYQTTPAELPADQPSYEPLPAANPASLSSRQAQPLPSQPSLQPHSGKKGASTHFGDDGDSTASLQSSTGAPETSARTGLGMGPTEPGDSNTHAPATKRKEKERFRRWRKLIGRGKSPPPETVELGFE